MPTEIKQARIYWADGTNQATDPTNKRDFSLEEMQKIVGGYIEMVYIGNTGYLLVINEEGKFEKPIRVNAAATDAVREFLQKDDFICGDVLFCHRSQIK